MIVAGRYNLAPAILVYGANMVLLAVTAIAITLVIERDIQRRLVPSGRPRIRRADRFGYSLDGNRVLQPRCRDVRLFPQSCLAAGAEVDGTRLSHVPDQSFNPDEECQSPLLPTLGGGRSFALEHLGACAELRRICFLKREQRRLSPAQRPKLHLRFPPGRI